MDFDRMTSIVARVFTAGAFMALGWAVLVKAAGVVGLSVPSPYLPSRLLELGVVLQVFVIPLLLRQIREGARKTGA